ncbi:hypothetical protein F5148DRAFT_1280967 [Russula earlei]|uniref:Uncharacterized protein n=1 Tax=Russula earlei TaxID=71964 RepID=A0ACC0UJI4_9AGAM|nr:hypothetical protein F5148DRAFT_1280967 [Russula earlei]
MKGLVVNSVSPEKQLLDILYKMPKDVSDDEWDNEVTEYAVHEVKLAFDQLVCPLCDTLGRLITKEMLEAHLEWDHPEVETNWRRRKNGSLELTLELPGDEILVDEWEGPESSRQANKLGSSSTLDPLDRHWPPVDAPPVSEPGPRESPTPTQQAATYVEHPVTAFFQLKPEFSPTPASRTASLIPDEASDSLHQAPGSRDPLGPLAVYPYHPVSVDDDNDTLGFSCRPCGPRLYDLVARYPMSDYGLTSWSLLERDEELFEIDDIRDEEKAMQALWNRWIFFKRRSYLLDHCKSVIEFVKTFHTTIMETAGWKGMRVWLLLLAKHKYLTGDDVVTIMAQYETIAAIEP